jgi:SAM-dependent methyltransferase
MIETGIEEINVDELMKKIKAEVKKRRTPSQLPEQGDFAHFPGNSSAGGISPGAFDSGSNPQSEPFHEKSDGYQMDDYLKYHHKDFVVNAYRGILKRSPDADGFDHFLRDLQSGKITKAEILGRLRYSPEGRSKKVKVKGLAVNFGIQLLFRIPVLGYLFRVIVGILNLPALFHNLQKLEVSTSAHLSDQRNQKHYILDRMQDQENAILDRMQDQENAILDRMQDQENKTSDSIGELSRRQAEFEKDIDDRAELKIDRTEIAALLESRVLCQLRDLKLMVIDQERRLKLLLEEARKRLPAPIDADQLGVMADEADHFHGAMYVSFEDQMRGIRKDIKDRQRVYLPYVEAANAGSELNPVIDLGCGRGEWLELLKENGFVAKGLEINKVMENECRELGLDVVVGDFFEFLKQQKINSLGAITGFQIVEHLGFKKMIELFDETLRVLKPGGIAIFETPNPENIIVATCDFYADPTHKNPIPPKTLQYLLEYRGFVDPKILRSTPMNFIKGALDDAIKDLVYRFNVGPDYAVIVRKA